MHTRKAITIPKLGREKKVLKEKVRQFWQQRMGVLKDKQTKPTAEKQIIVESKKQIIEKLFSITEVTSCVLSPKS